MPCQHLMMRAPVTVPRQVFSMVSPIWHQPGSQDQRDRPPVPVTLPRRPPARARGGHDRCWTDRTRCPGSSVADSTTRPACSTCS